MICLGIIGEYIGKIYSEIKARPRYIIEAIENDECAITGKKEVVYNNVKPQFS